eukprot:2652645-Prymnesium_polylepis.1
MYTLPRVGPLDWLSNRLGGRREVDGARFTRPMAELYDGLFVEEVPEITSRSITLLNTRLGPTPTRAHRAAARPAHVDRPGARLDRAGRGRGPAARLAARTPGVARAAATARPPALHARARAAAAAARALRAAGRADGARDAAAVRAQDRRAGAHRAPPRGEAALRQGGGGHGAGRGAQPAARLAVHRAAADAPAARRARVRRAAAGAADAAPVERAQGGAREAGLPDDAREVAGAAARV